MTKPFKTQRPLVQPQDLPSPWANLRLPSIEYRSADHIIGYSRRLRKADEKVIEALMTSLRTFGFVLPVLIDQHDVLISGEAMVEAARRLGMLIPTVRIDHLCANDVRVLRLALNQLSTKSKWDDDMLRVELKELITLDLDMSLETSGFSLAQIDQIVFATQPSDDEGPAPDPKCAVAQVGDLWQLENHKIYCGSTLDRRSFELLMGTERAQMVFTDSPFNVKINGHVSGLGKVRHREFLQGAGELDEAGFIDFQTVAIRNLAEFCEDGALLYMCMDHRHMWEIMSGIRANGLQHINLAIWDKQVGGMGSLYRSQHELFFIAKKGTARHRNNVNLGANGRNRTNIWPHPGMSQFGAGRDEQLQMHSTPKPVPLVAEAIRDVTHRGEIVLDGFLGSGTTLIAAERTERICRAIDLDPLYVDVAIRRWQKITGKDAVLVATGQTFAALEASPREEPEPEQPPVPAINPRPRRRAA